MNYRITFGRIDDPKAVRGVLFRSRIRALKLANYLSFVLFQQYPFRNSETKGCARHEGRGFFIEYQETEEEIKERNYNR